MCSKKTIKSCFQADEISYCMEAHNGISSKIVENAGFDAIWASGFTISSSLGHRDCNEISWTNLCDMVGYIVQSTHLPVLVDGDTGFGNFNNVRQLVKRLCQIGAKGVCLEDKIFPKTNSFLPYHQDLVSPQEFVGKIKAAKDSQTDPDFCVIARTETLISGGSVDEALSRAYAYGKAGADGIVVHSKSADPSQIIEFSRLWDFSIPLIVIPTSYGRNTPLSVYKECKVSMVIWANQLFRASVMAMQKVAATIAKERSIVGVDSEICCLDTVFSLVNEKELREAEYKYYGDV